MDNILIGKQDISTIYLIDFGLSSSYLDANGMHIKKQYQGKFSGNLLFASYNSCRGNNKSRRDDVQSLMYMMVYLLRGCLPWSDLKLKFKNKPFEFYLKKRFEVEYVK